MADLPFELRDRGAYLPGADALVVADTHFGRVRASNVEFPLDGDGSAAERLLDLVQRFNPAEVVIAGDVLHSFSRIPRGIEEVLSDLCRGIEARGSSPVLVEGNHDSMLDSIAPVDPVSAHRLADGTVVHHGHGRPGAGADRYVIGHEHPAIAVEGERRPCFLWGERAFEGSDVLALPAFDELAAGVEVNGLSGRDVQSPLLSDLDAFRPVVYDPGAEDVLAFPALGDLREYL